MGTPFWDNGAGSDGSPIYGPGTSGPIYMQQEWDTARLGGTRVPGLVQVLIPSKQRRVQNKKQNGTDGATPTFRGMDPAKVQIRVILWTPAQLSAWDALLPIIFPNPNKDINKLSAVDISHPATHQRSIKSVIIEDIDGPSPGQVSGSKEYVLKCCEYIPSSGKSALKSPAGSAAVPVTPAFQQATKNSPPPPSQTDFGPTPNVPAQGGSR